MSDLPTYVVSRKTTRKFTLTILASSPLTSAGVTGMTFTMMAKNKISDADSAAVITKTDSQFTRVTVGDASTDAVLTFTLNPADTAGLALYTTLQMDIRVQDAQGGEQVLNRGVLIIDDVVTQAVVTP